MRGQEGSEQAQKGDHNFFFLSIGYDAVFDGLSESEIKNSADVTWNEKWSKYKVTKNGFSKKSQ